MDEIPNKVYVPLGRRGFDPVPLKYCHLCNDRSGRITLVEKEESQKQEGNTIFQEIDYKIKCPSCNGTFYIRIRKIQDNTEGKKRKISSTANILNENKEDMGWLGTF